jgi:hypothetical protein
MKGMVVKKLHMWEKFDDYQYFSANFLSIEASKAVSMICKRSY